MKAYCKCEKCGNKADVDISKVLTSLPAKYEYTCKNDNCNYHGYVLTSNVDYDLENTESNLKGFLSYQYPDTRDCSSCTHAPVCRFKEEYKKRISEIAPDLHSFIRVKIECIYYSGAQSNAPNIRYLYTDGTKSGYLTATACDSCEFHKKLLQDGVYVGDSPCEWCKSNPYKLTCTSTVDNKSVTAKTPLKSNKTILNESINLSDNFNNKIEEK